MDGKATINVNEKQLGTLIAYMNAGFGDRELVKEVAKNIELKHLNDINEEFRLLMELTELMKQIINKDKK